MEGNLTEDERRELENQPQSDKELRTEERKARMKRGMNKFLDFLKGAAEGAGQGALDKVMGTKSAHDGAKSMVSSILQKYKWVLIGVGVVFIGSVIWIVRSVNNNGRRR